MIAAIVAAMRNFRRARRCGGRQGQERRRRRPHHQRELGRRATQVGSPTPYKFELTINAKGAGRNEISDLDCIGKLTRSGSSKTCTFFVEVITKGSADKGGRCPDGTMTLARQGDNLALGWFAAFQAPPSSPTAR